MLKIRTYIKQSDNGVAGHVYEHVVASHVAKGLSQLGYQQLLDYELRADTYDGIVVLRFETYSLRVLRKFEKLVNGAEVDSKTIKVAVEQIRCEYERAGSLDFTKLGRLVRKLSNDPWIKIEDFGFSRPIDDQARELMTDVGGFGRKAIKSFDHFDFVYTLKDCPYELKALAVYLVQIIGLVHIDELYKDIKYCYDAGDEWAEYQDLIGYSHTLTVPKAHGVKLSTLEKHFQESFQGMGTKQFIKKVSRYVKRDIAQPFSYFGRGSLFAKSYQIVGEAGMNQAATAENIRTVLEQIKVSIEKVS